MPTIECDGRVVAYTETGTGSGAPLLCLHGFTGAKEDFAEVSAPLGTQRRVVAIDLPGHGGSEPLDGADAYGVGALGAWTLRVATALHLGEHHLLGHSLGGLIAQRAAARGSDRVRGLVLASTGLGAPREAVCEWITQIGVAARDEGTEAARRTARASRSARGHDVEREDEVAERARFASLDREAVVGTARGLLTATPVGAFLRGIDVPVLVLTGTEDDVWTLAEQRHLARRAAGARHEVVAGAGHSAHLDAPERWARAVAAFLAAADAAR